MYWSFQNLILIVSIWFPNRKFDTRVRQLFLVISLVNLEPPAAHIWTEFLISYTAASTHFVDFNKWSIYKSFNNVLSSSWLNLSLVSLATFFTPKFEKLGDEVTNKYMCAHRLVNNVFWKICFYHPQIVQKTSLVSRYQKLGKTWVWCLS